MDDAEAAGRLLLAGFADPRHRLPGLPEALRPRTTAAAYAIQRMLAEALGEIGGWKVGAAGPEQPAACAPMPARHIMPSPARLPAATFTERGVESEIAFRLARDLPARAEPYDAADIMGAIAAAHPAIEILQSRFAEPDAQDPLCGLADLISHGGFVYGPPIADWRSVDFAAMTIHQTATGTADRSRTGNPAGDMTRLIVWLANEGAAWAGGLKAGQYVTCGSWTGKSFPPAGGRAVTRFSGCEPVIVDFE